MRKLSLLTIGFALLLSACADVKATVPDDPNAQASQALVEKWITAYETSDADTLLSLWSEDIAWTACIDSPCNSYYLQELKYYVPRDFKNPKFSMKIQSYLITTSGKFAIVHALYTDPFVGLQTPTPAVAILEFEDGEISNEKWYW